jgi:BTB/POZ domain
MSGVRKEGGKHKGRAEERPKEEEKNPSSQTKGDASESKRKERKGGAREEQREQQDETVRLNVGGRRFMTTKTTLELRGPNLLTKLLERDADGTLKSVRDEKGYLFIDRSPATFSLVLEYLRTGKLFFPTSGGGTGSGSAAPGRELQLGASRSEGSCGCVAGGGGLGGHGVSLEQLEEEFDFFGIPLPGNEAPAGDAVLDPGVGHGSERTQHTPQRRNFRHSLLPPLPPQRPLPTFAERAAFEADLNTLRDQMDKELGAEVFPVVAHFVADSGQSTALIAFRFLFVDSTCSSHPVFTSRTSDKSLTPCTLGRRGLERLAELLNTVARNHALQCDIYFSTGSGGAAGAYVIQCATIEISAIPWIA